MLTIENQDINASINQTDIPVPESFKDSFLKISKLSWQMSVSYTFCIQMSAVVYMLSQLDDSEDNLDAITLITSFVSFLVFVGVSPLLPMSLVAGKQLGELNKLERVGEICENEQQQKREHIAAVFGNGLIISALVSPFMILPMVFSKDILTKVFSQNDDVAAIAQSFIRPYAATVPPLLARVCADQVMFLFKRTKPAMVMSLTTFSISLTIGGILAFGKLGSPKLGADGVLLGCIIGVYMESLGYLLYLRRSPRLNKFNFYDLYKKWSPYYGQLNDILNLGGSMVLTMSTELSMNLMLNSFSGIVGAEEQAAMAAILQFSLFSVLLQTAFGQACVQEMSREIGKENFFQASKIGKIGVIAIFSYITPVLLLLAIYPDILADIMAKNDQSMKDSLKYLAPIMFVGCILDAERFLVLQQMRVLGDAQISSKISASCVVLGIALSGVLGLKTNMGIYGVATGFTASSGLAAAILFSRWLSRIQPENIKKTKENPEKFHSIKNCIAFFSSKKDSSPQGSEDLKRQIENPLNPMHEVSLA